jgi:hypothetical protein
VRHRKVDGNCAVARTEDAGLNFDDARELGFVANRPNGFRAVPSIGAKVLCSAEAAIQPLALLHHYLPTESFRMELPSRS